jgi:hypothetical protein
MVTNVEVTGTRPSSHSSSIPLETKRRRENELRYINRLFGSCFRSTICIDDLKQHEKFRQLATSLSHPVLQEYARQAYRTIAAVGLPRAIQKI